MQVRPRYLNVVILQCLPLIPTILRLYPLRDHHPPHIIMDPILYIELENLVITTNTNLKLGHPPSTYNNGSQAIHRPT